ncbi:bchH, partial [Symbiodinium microadriaticum]
MASSVAWSLQSKYGIRPLSEDVEEMMLRQEWFSRHGRPPDSDNHAYALTRNKLPEEPPTGRKLEEVRQMMMRLHRSSGHTSFSNIAKLLQRRGAPSWAVTLARGLQCPACIESSKPLPSPPASTAAPPELYEIVGTDVFEYTFKNEAGVLKKLKDAWEPTTADIIRMFTRDWMMHNPAPRWLMADSALYYVSEETREFCGKSGTGLLIAPPECHWLMSHEEQLVGRLKATVGRMMKEDLDLAVATMFHYACHAHNSTIQVPEGLNPRKAFSEVLKFREKAAVAYRRAQAADQMSKLNNTTSRPPQTFDVGSLVMMWREKRSGGRGGWQGPVRVLLREGSTYWLAPGAAIIRAKANQLRKCSRPEEAVAITSGAAVYRMPVTVENLLRGFRGKQYDDISGAQPPREALEDTSQAEVRVQPRPRRAGEDYWEIQGEWLVRVHVTPRLTMLVPGKTKNIPVAEDQLTGERRTIVKSGDNEQTIEDNFRCTLPGGHRLPHVDAGGNKFIYDKRTSTSVPVEESGEETSVQSKSSGSEMIPDDEHPPPSGGRKRKSPEGTEDMGYMFEVPIQACDFKRLVERPRHAEVWLSNKMMDKGREVSWSSLSLDQKKEFDTAMAKEISNVLRNCAVRALSSAEKGQVDIRRVMKMRWVLTFKSDGRSKARLVVLGYQAPNLIESQASSPTLSKLGKLLILSIVANNLWMLESADVSSAFLQSLQDMEKEDLFIYAPAELAAAFGEDGSQDSTILKLTRAFYGLCSAPKSWYDTVTMTLKSSGWTQLEFDRCFFILLNKEKKLVGVAGFHVDDFQLGGESKDRVFQKAKQELLSAFEWGKWDQKNFEFAGANLTQKDDGTIFLDQKAYTEKWVEEISIDHSRATQLKSRATPSEISSMRGALGTIAWRAHQVSPQFLAEAGLLLSEIPTATVDTFLRINKLVREMKRNADQTLIFHPFQLPWQDLVAVTWADAAQNNRANKGSTIGVLTCLAPRSILDGEAAFMNIISWKSSKAPREVLGSNGSEVQAITIGEDLNYLVRCAWLEAHGHPPIRGKQAQMVRDMTSGALVMDSKGIFDAMTKNSSSLHGLRSSRAGYELTISVKQAVSAQTHLRWVAGTEQLADGLTKGKARGILLRLLGDRQRWRLVYDPEFTAGKKLSKREQERRIREVEQHFIHCVKVLAEQGLHTLGAAPSVDEMRGYLTACFEETKSSSPLPAAAIEKLAESAPDSDVIGACVKTGTDNETVREAIREASRLRDLLNQNHEELRGMLRALNGEYVPPAPGGDVIRDGASVLPTGRNIHALDPYRVPSATALARGLQAAEKSIEQYQRDNDGRYPETLAVNLWGLEAIKTRGESVAVVLGLVGARPVAEATGRVARYELIPLEELGRPRVDALCSLSGIFRDSFANIV